MRSDAPTSTGDGQSRLCRLMHVHRSVGIVLVGGLSSRMGTSKALLEWHGSTLARRVVGIVARGVDGPVVVVRSAGQSLPSLPREIEVLDDLENGRGPLAGLAVGLAALSGRGEVAYVSSTDVPFLHPVFVRRVLGEVGDDVEAGVPCVRGFRQTLAAAYRVDLACRVKQLVDEDRLRLSYLLETCRWVELDEALLLADADLARIDPGLESVTNLNELSDYEAARAKPAPTVVVERTGQLLPDQAHGPRFVRAATLGAAADAAGTPLAGDIVAVLNGDQISHDPEEPTVEGDVISLMSAADNR
jgi:molybdopterin-guanine dinucleotide biosynthesis protein A